MPNKMLIDATHPEETRVVVLRGNRVEEFDFESANRKQLRGNIYLAKVTRVEPSLQAAFVDYGGNRHGFLAFSEIHPDYYQIPVADRQALIAQEEHDARAADAEADHRARGGGRSRNRHRGRGADRHRDVRRSEPVGGEEPVPEHIEAGENLSPGEATLGGLPPQQPEQTENPASEPISGESAGSDPMPSEPAPETFAAPEPAAEAVETQFGEAEVGGVSGSVTETNETPEGGEDHAESGDHLPLEAAASAEAIDHDEAHEAGDGRSAQNGDDEHGNGDDHHEEEVVESVGGADALEEAQERMPRFRRQYKIQEVIKRRQVMLVQVVKEERGSKGAALTTYLSLAGRYSVLMPNTARGGGISRKITSGEDRNRLKEIAQDLEVPEGMGVILRTAGASRTKTEVKRDFEYLLRVWETVRDLTLKSMAPKLVYEEGSLTKRSIRDLYNKDIDEIIVSGDEAYKDAKDFMRMLMPSHAKHVKPYKDPQPLFTRYGVESQLDAMFSPIVQLRSGGYIVINQAEALVAIDVNSGRATREHHIEDTALKTNCEAAEEVARQLRLRDLAGLIVIDFIDMDETRNNRSVERRLKESLKHDRARIQVGRISHFGLMEMSRQRIRTSVLESSTEKCPLCGGSGHVRSVSSVALQLLRGIEEILIKGATHNLIVRTRSEVALYVLNHKRAHLRALEERYRISITVSADPTVSGQQSFVIDRGEQVHTPEAARSIAAALQTAPAAMTEDEAEDFAIEDEVEAEAAAEAEAEAEGETAESYDEIEQVEAVPDEAEAAEPRGNGHAVGETEREGGPRRRRRRGRGRGRGEGPREGAREGAPQFTRDTVAEHAVAHEDHDAGEPGEFEDFAGEAQDASAPAGGRQQGPGQDAGPAGENGDGRRRRRRGRRGGRRNRHGRNGEAPFADNGGPQQDQQGEPQHAGADFPPVSDEDASAIAPAYETPMAPPPPPAPAVARPAAPPPAAASAPAPESEPPRRRSTIREPAPIALGSTPPMPPATLPPPTPVISSTVPEEAATPKRGWWGRRILGDKG
jgi:ribonuclease E